MRPISVALLPSDVTPDHHVSGSLVVLIHHRITSTAVTALASGANSVHMRETVYGILKSAKLYNRSDVVLAGESPFEDLGAPIPTFDKGLSPQQFLLGCEGKTVLLKTKNVSRALFWLRDAKVLVLGSFLNATQVVQTCIEHANLPVVFVCATPVHVLRRITCIAADAKCPFGGNSGASVYVPLHRVPCERAGPDRLGEPQRSQRKHHMSALPATGLRGQRAEDATGADKSGIRWSQARRFQCANAIHSKTSGVALVGLILHCIMPATSSTDCRARFLSDATSHCFPR